MTVTRARPGVANSATFTPTNPGDEILDATFSKLTGASGNPFALPFTGGDITETIAGANQMTLTLVDPGLELLRAGTFNGVYEVNLDGVPFWVTQVSLVDTDTLSLLLEHRIIAKLRLHDSYLKVSRDSMTRAQFLFLMVNEIKDEEILYISPEIGVKQPITVAKTPKHAPVPGKAPGFTPGVKLKVKGVDATAAQLAQADALLAECVKLGTSSKVMQAIICAGIQESVLGADPSTFTPTTFDGAGTWGVLSVAAGSGSLPGSGIGAHDTTTMAHYFCIGGKGMEGGGAIAYSAAHPASSPGDIARHVENPGSATAPYAQWEPEAKAIVEAYTNSSIQYAGSPPGVAAATGEFYRGQPGQPEDSWTCALRLAAEVNWRAFVAGRHSFYYVQDKDLMTQQARYLIDRQSTGVQKVTFDVETGKRLVRIRGALVPKPSAAVLTVRIDRWQAPPGTVVELADYGPANGRWLVSDIQRQLFDEVATVTLHAPQAQLAEPVGSTTSGGFQVSSASVTPGTAQSVYSGPSVNGYVNPLSKIQGLGATRHDMGCDYYGTGPVVAVGNGTIYAAGTGNTGWGPPAGPAPGGFIGQTLDDGPRKGEFVYYAEGIVPQVRVNQKVKAGEAIGQMVASVEFGWGTGVPNEAYAARKGGGYSGGGRRTAAGLNFNTFMVKLGAPPCHPDSVNGGLPIQGHYP